MSKITGEFIIGVFVVVIIAIVVLVLIQHYQSNPIPNSGSLKNDNTQQNFTVDRENTLSNANRLNKNQFDNNYTFSKENQKATSNFIDNILKNQNQTENQNRQKKSKNLSEDLDSETEEYVQQDNLSNPLTGAINQDRNSLMDSDEQVLDELIKEVTTGNDLIVNNPKSELYKNKSKSINSAKKYRKVSYKDSGYRYDFNDDGSPSQTSQDELNSMYDDAIIFRNNEYNTNGNFTGFNDDTDKNYGNANLNDFKASGQQTQQEKIMSLYNSNEYLPNNNLLDKKLTNGFQILDNPVAVSNPSLIPVLKSIPVSSVMGSNRNQTYDIRAEPPCPKTVVSPFLNSSIMPDIYSTQRGCL